MNIGNVSRRSFFKLGGSAAAVAGLGLAGCGGKGSDAGSTGEAIKNTPSGVPATTPLDKLPIPEKGAVCYNKQERSNLKQGGSFILPTNELGPDWNNYSVNGNTTSMHYLWNCYMPFQLFLSDATASKYTANPDYIESYHVDESTGKQVLTINMNPKATFNDGTPIDYRAFKAVVDCNSGKIEGYTGASTDGFEQVESVVQGENAQQVVITFETPFYPAEGLFTGVLHPDSADVEVFNKGWVNNPHSEWGAGPFKIDSFDETQVTFVPNEKWWGDEPMLEKIVYKQMESQALFNAFKNGEIDATVVGASGTSEMLSNFNNMQDAEIRRTDSISLAQITLNSTRESLQDINVRKAFTQCLDMSTILKIIYQGVNWQEETPGSYLLMPWVDGYKNNMPEDVQKLKTAEEHTAAAKKTLEDAGYTLNGEYYEKNGERVSFNFMAIGDSNVVKNRAAAIQQMAKQAGIEVRIDTKPSSEFSTALDAGDWGAFLFGWSSSATSVCNVGQMYDQKSASNYTHLGSAEIDAMCDKVPTISDHNKQTEAMNEAETAAMAQYGFIPVYSGTSVTVCKKGVANFGESLFEDLLPQNYGWQK